MSSRGPFQSQQFSDFVIQLLWLIVINYNYYNYNYNMLIIIIKEVYANL